MLIIVARSTSVSDKEVRWGRNIRLNSCNRLSKCVSFLRMRKLNVKLEFDRGIDNVINFTIFLFIYFLGEPSSKLLRSLCFAQGQGCKSRHRRFLISGRISQIEMTSPRSVPGPSLSFITLSLQRMVDQWERACLHNLVFLLSTCVTFVRLTMSLSTIIWSS